ncbi:MAG TPA: NAD-dependent epimerase/dehydratase family protein [Gemmatimonadaceae bacterium]|nr:NAD-dependent epimerase/dehydratase family protein [Gemmatimonadaceae bacterium]
MGLLIVRVIVIGATGHIGTWLIPGLVRRGHEVVAVSRGARRPYRDFDEWSDVRHVTIDREQSEQEGSFGRRIAALRPDAVVDLICFHPESAVPLVDALDGRVEHFIHCGTLWVHGVPRSRPYDETVAREPFGDYGIRKARIESFLLEKGSEGFPATVLHPGHITGPGWDPINPAGNLDRDVFARLSRGDVVTLPDRGEATLQHVHADDVAQAFALALDKPTASIGESFHVASLNPVTLRSYAEAAAAWWGREANLEYLPMVEWQKTVGATARALTRDHILHSPFASIDKAQRVLGFDPRYTAVQAARDAVAAFTNLDDSA